MPLPILIPIVIGLAGVFGVGKSVKAGIDVHKAKKHKSRSYRNHSKS